MLKVLIACVWLAGSTYGAMAQAASVVFLNPGSSTETFWVSYAQFMQAAARELGLDLRVRYSEPNADNTLVQARETLQGTQRPDYLVLVNEQYVAPKILRMARGSLVADDEQAGYLMLIDLLRSHAAVAPGASYRYPFSLQLLLR